VEPIADGSGAGFQHRGNGLAGIETAPRHVARALRALPTNDVSVCV
jgi:hypothetical protein